MGLDKLFAKAKHNSFWIENNSRSRYPQLTENIEVDVAIVGSGITGITAGYLLSKAGKRVAILERNKIIEGVTGYTSAKVSALHTLIYHDLIEKFGIKHARHYADAQIEALDFIASTVKEEQIDCNFNRASSYTYTERNENVDKIWQEAEAAIKLDLPGSYVLETDLPYQIKAAVRFTDQAYFHPRNYLLKLAELIAQNGGLIYENTTVVNVSEENLCTLKTFNNKTITAKSVIVATNYPIIDKGGYFARLKPQRSYVLGVYIDGQVPEGMYINCEEPLFSVRPQQTEKGPMLIITGVHDTPGKHIDTESYYNKLLALAREKFKVREVAYYWLTHDSYAPDKLPYVGRYTHKSKNMYVAGGYSGWGMTNGTAAAMLLSDQILGIKNSNADTFDPWAKHRMRDLKEVIKNASFVGKEFIVKRAQKKNEQSINNLPHGQGIVIDSRGQKIAVYKDQQGKLHKFSAKCTHMGCIVQFNNAERTWDCPCHGSRFDSTGQVIHAPAIDNLKSLK
jgi:glycine/D-amino acid oxidase-like deaminating enzyme/nitrite reductase/ring-hydroxylating ferredoxin subunit